MATIQSSQNQQTHDEKVAEARRQSKERIEQLAREIQEIRQRSIEANKEREKSWWSRLASRIAI